jgi:hypothetical protein
MHKTSKITLSIAAGFGLSLFTPSALAPFSQPSFRDVAIDVALAVKPGDTPVQSAVATPCADPQQCFDTLKSNYGTFSSNLADAYIPGLENQVGLGKGETPVPRPKHIEMRAALQTMQSQTKQLRLLISPTDYATLTADLSAVEKTIDNMLAIVFNPLHEGGGVNSPKLQDVQNKLIDFSKKENPSLSLSPTGEYNQETFEAIKTFLTDENGKLNQQLTDLDTSISQVPQPSATTLPSASISPPANGDIKIGNWSFNPWWLSLLAVPVVGFLVWKLGEKNEKWAEDNYERNESERNLDTSDQRKAIAELKRKVSDLEGKNVELGKVVANSQQQTKQQADTIKILEHRIDTLDEKRQDQKHEPPSSQKPDIPPAPRVYDNFPPDRESFPSQSPPTQDPLPDRLSELYNSSSHFPQNHIIATVAETQKSLGDRRLGQSKTPIMEPKPKGAYWIIRDPDRGDRQCLVPIKNVQLNTHSFETLRDLYEYDEALESIPATDLNIKLVTPATVIQNSDGTWILDEKGTLEY